MQSSEFDPVKKTEIIFDGNKKVVTAVINPQGLDSETIRAIADNLVKSPRHVTFYNSFVNPNTFKIQETVTTLSASHLERIQSLEPTKKEKEIKKLAENIAGVQEVTIMDPEE